MNCRTIFRTAALAAILQMGTSVMAEERAAAPAAPAAPVAPAGGGLRSTGGGGGGAKPAPQPGQPPAPPSGGSRGGQPGQPPPPPAKGSPGTGKQPGQPPAANPPATPPQPGQTAPGARPAHNLQPGSAAQSEQERHQREAADEAARHHKPATRQSIVIFPRTLHGWAPYSWWYSGNSYWWPPMEGVGDDPYYNRDQRRADDGSPGAAPPTVPPDTSSPSLDQAKALNELEGMPAYRQALADLKLAQSEFDTASRKALEKLKDNKDYQELIRRRDHAEDRVEAVQAGARLPNPEKVTPAAQRKLEVSAKITRMEQDAITADPTARAAQAKVVEANERVTAMRQQSRGNAVR